MIPPIVGGLISYLTPILANSEGLPQASIWDGETPRWDAQGNAVGPTNVTGSWPMVSLQMQEPGFKRKYAVGTNPTCDEGIIVIQMWAVTREEVEDLMTVLSEAMEAQIIVYIDVAIGGPSNNPNYVIQSLLETYWSGQDKDYRTSTSQLLYRGDLYFRLTVHGSTTTTT